MLQVVFITIAIVFASAYGAQAQEGVVTPFQRLGGISPVLLDKLRATETKYQQASNLVNGYLDELDVKPDSCTGNTIYANGCASFPGARRLTEVSRTSSSTTGDLLALGSGLVDRVESYLNSNGCPTASGWSLCTLDQLRQAHSLRITGYNPGTAFSARYFALDPGWIGWAGGDPATTSTSCAGMGSSSAGHIAPSMEFNTTARYANAYQGCNISAPLFCCKTE